MIPAIPVAALPRLRDAEHRQGAFAARMLRHRIAAEMRARAPAPDRAVCEASVTAAEHALLGPRRVAIQSL